MGDVVKKLLKVGTSFIPGVGPLVSGGIGAAFDAFSGSGKQGGMKGSSQQTSNQNYSGMQEAIEDPYFSLLRKAMGGQLAGAFQDSKKPVYGEQEKANVLSDLNDLASDSMAALRANLGAVGGSNSGRALGGMQEIQKGRTKEATAFLSQIPLLNRQYKDNQVNSLLGIGTNFTGRAPISTKTSGTQSGTSNSIFNQDYTGPSFLKGLAGNLGGLFGAFTGDQIGGKSKVPVGWGEPGIDY